MVIKAISIRFQGVRVGQPAEFVQVQAEVDDRYLDLVVPVSEEMRAKPFQVDNVAGEFLFDLIAAIENQINPTVGE
jgi:hypothetical protein